MSLVPSLWRDWWVDFDRPHRLLDLRFRRPLWRDDLLNTLALSPFDWYFRPWDRLIEHKVSVSTTTTTTTNAEDTGNKYTITLDVQQFCPHEILVKTNGNSIIIEAKHEECKPCDGYTTTEFMRRYELPSSYDINRVMCNLSKNGVLTITAPKACCFCLPGPRERIVPIDRLCCKAIKC